MKITKYSCDCEDCDNTTNNINDSNWLEIGSESNKLFINNHFKERKLIFLNEYSSIHFCSPKCLTKYFFSSPELLNPSN